MAMPVLKNMGGIKTMEKAMNVTSRRMTPAQRRKYQATQRRERLLLFIRQVMLVLPSLPSAILKVSLGVAVRLVVLLLIIGALFFGLAFAYSAMLFLFTTVL